MESELFEDWHLPNIPLPKPTLTLPNLLSDYFCDVTSFEDAMDESLARLALFNVSGIGVIINSVNYDCFPSAISGNPHGRLQPRAIHPHDILGRQLHYTTSPQGCWITRYGSVQSIWFFLDLVTMVCSQETEHY